MNNWESGYNLWVCMLLTFRKCRHTDFDMNTRLSLYIATRGSMYLAYIFASAGLAASSSGLSFAILRALFICDVRGGQRCESPSAQTYPWLRCGCFARRAQNARAHQLPKHRTCSPSELSCFRFSAGSAASASGLSFASLRNFLS